MEPNRNASANSNWSAPAEPMVPRLSPPEPEREADPMRPTGWSPTAWRFSKENKR